jgi:hypothetical protein
MTDAERAILADYIDVFATPAGKRVLEDMKRRAGYYGSCVVEGGSPTADGEKRIVWFESRRAFVIGIEGRAKYDFSKEPVENKETKNA